MKLINLFHLFSIGLAGRPRPFQRALADNRINNFSSFHHQGISTDEKPDYHVSIPEEVVQLLEKISKYSRFQITGENDELWQLYAIDLV